MIFLYQVASTPKQDQILDVLGLIGGVEKNQGYNQGAGKKTEPEYNHVLASDYIM